MSISNSIGVNPRRVQFTLIRNFLSIILLVHKKCNQKRRLLSTNRVFLGRFSVAILSFRGYYDDTSAI